MDSRLLVSLASVALFAATGCQDSAAPAARSAPAPRFAKHTASGSSDSQVILVWDDAVNGLATGIRGDGRDAMGQTTLDGTNAYQGSYCGVWGVIYNQKGESGNVRFDPDTYYAASMSAACGARRSELLYPSDGGPVLGPAQVGYSEALLFAIWQLATGQTASTEMRIGPVPLPDGTTCTLDFNQSKYPNSSSPTATRLADVQVVNSAGLVVARQWRVTSQGSHTAECLVKAARSGNLVDSGRQVYLPFAVTITEMPYPYATFP